MQMWVTLFNKFIYMQIEDGCRSYDCKQLANITACIILTTNNAQLSKASELHSVCVLSNIYVLPYQIPSVTIPKFLIHSLQ